MKKITQIFLVFIFIYSHGKVLNASWLWNWNYRKSITVWNSSSTLTDYQLLITTDTAVLISSGKMRTDCGDIRFADSDGITQLNYWLESGCNSTLTRIWVKFSSIPAVSTKTIYMYYGNPSAVSQSDGKSTFEFFDDFFGTSLDTTAWQAWATNVTLSNGIVTTWGGSLNLEARNTADGGIIKTQNTYRVRVRLIGHGDYPRYGCYVL